MVVLPSRSALRLVAAMGLVFGCDAPTVSDAGLDAAIAPDAPLDAPSDAGPSSCLDALTERAPFAVAPGFRRTQIHPAAAFDGEHLWVTLTVAAEEGSSFDVVIVPLGCDGTPGSPIPVDDEVTPNDIDGTLAIDGDTLLVAWQRDVGDGKVAIWTRPFDLSGVPIGPSAALSTTREGAPVTGTHWFPQLVATGDGFLMVASRGVEALSSFQVFTQRFDATGAPVGEAEEPALDLLRSETATSAIFDGALYFGYDALPAADEPAQAVFAAPSGTHDLGDALVGSATPSLARIGSQVMVAFDVSSAARGVSIYDPRDGATTEVGPGGAGAFLASSGVLWLSGFRGFSADAISARAITPTLELGPVVTIPTTAPVPVPYRPALHTLSGELHLVIFSEGTSPVFEARAAFVRLPAP